MTSQLCCISVLHLSSESQRGVSSRADSAQARSVPGHSHHLDPPDVVQLLKGMAARARQLVIVDDLIRSRLGYSLAWIGTRLLSRSWVVHYDGPLSVKAAFTPEEILDLASQADLGDCVLERTWPERYRLCWRPPAEIQN